MTQMKTGLPTQTLGILMLNTRFPRIPGDIGNPDTFPYGVRYALIEPATVDKIVTADGPAGPIMDAFVEAAHGLVDEGVAGLTTSCGFMAIAQKELAGRCHVPVLASSLCQIPLVQSTLPSGKKVGVLNHRQHPADRHAFRWGRRTDRFADRRRRRRRGARTHHSERPDHPRRREGRG